MSEAGSNGRVGAGEAARVAGSMVEGLTGRRPESVSGLARDEDGGWRVAIDVVELSRVPPSTDLLATYEVVVDAGGELVDLTRIRRFVRGQADEE